MQHCYLGYDGASAKVEVGGRIFHTKLTHNTLLPNTNFFLANSAAGKIAHIVLEFCDT